MTKESRIPVLIAGIGGASLGTELAKSLALAGCYDVYGCDVSPHAFGHFADEFVDTFVVDRDRYVPSILELCHRERIRYLVPGGEQPMVLLNGRRAYLAENDVILLANSPQVIEEFSDKSTTFERLHELGVEIPITIRDPTTQQLADLNLPIIVKAATGTGGSSFVFLATTDAEAALYVNHIRANGREPLLQEYIAHTEGEFTVGVLSLPDGRIASSVALKRLFHVKLSVMHQSESGLISSGYSQGYIDDYPGICRSAEAIARAVGSTGPLNVQGRLRKGKLIPFEINPRFSASTYLRALAGINEIDLCLQHLEYGTIPTRSVIKSGYYLRTLAEMYVPAEGGKL